jgi:hypothetical protein
MASNVLWQGTRAFSPSDSYTQRLVYKRPREEEATQPNSKRQRLQTDERKPREKVLQHTGLVLLIMSFADVRETCNWASVSRVYNLVVEESAHDHWKRLALLGIQARCKWIRLKNTKDVYRPKRLGESSMLFICQTCKCKSYAKKYESSMNCEACRTRGLLMADLDDFYKARRVSDLQGLAMYTVFDK